MGVSSESTGGGTLKMGNEDSRDKQDFRDTNVDSSISGIYTK